MNGKKARSSGSRRGAVTAFYEAADGSRVDLPENAPPDGPIPGFETSDLPWLSEAVAQAEADLAAYRTDVSGGANPVYSARLAPAEEARQKGRDRFGPDGSDFLRELNEGRVWPDFWGAMFQLLGRRAERATRIQGQTQERILDILNPLPPGLRQSLLAQAFFPAMRKPRKWEGFHALVIEELKQPWADLRHWEVGAPKIATVAKMPDDLLIEIARSYGARMRQMTGFAVHARDMDPDKAPYRPSTESVPGERPADRGEALAILETQPIAPRFEAGPVQSEVNLCMTQAFHVTMKRVKPGIPEGHLMHLVLSTKPYGPTWPSVTFAEFPVEVVWPYVASHLDIIGRALVEDRLPWEPRLEPLKALRSLALLPKLPADCLSGVEHQARSKSKACRTEAVRLLDTMG